MTDTALDPQAIAQAVAIEVADEPEHVGGFVTAVALDDHVTDYRFQSNVRGYEGWQWSVTLYHDEELDNWTVNESSLVPTDQALMPPAWIPWKDRLEPTDLSPTDALGTEPDDPRLEDGVASAEAEGDSAAEADAASDEADGTFRATEPVVGGETAEESASSGEEPSDGTESAGESASVGEAVREGESESVTSPEDMAEAVEAFELSRRRVLTPLGRAQTAKRWYEGPRGPKSLSTKTASGNLCSTCGFFVPLQGELNLMFGVCANKWSPDDGRVVSLDHGCGEHSEIEPPEPGRLWVQSKPAYDDLHIDVVAQAPREERVQVELLEEELDEEAEATEADIEAQAVPASAVEDEDSAESNDEPAVEAVIDLAENDEPSESDESDDSEDSSDSDESDDSDDVDGAGDSDEADSADGIDEAEDSGDIDVPAESDDSAVASEAENKDDAAPMKESDESVEE